MSTFLGQLQYTLAAANKTHLIWCAVIFLMLPVLAILHHRRRYYTDKLRSWRKLCLIPFLVTTVHYFIYVTGAPDLLSIYTPMYLIAVLAMLPAICAERPKGYRITASVTGALSLIFTLYFFSFPPNVHNYTRKSYTASFHALVKEMDRYYVTKEWKEIDLTELENKYMPMIREAEQEKDPAKFADSVAMFCNELHDGHVSVRFDYDTEKYSSIFDKREYGLAMIGLDSGEVIAICTTKDVNALGIEDGTVITKWNGKPVLKAAEEDVPDRGMPVKANADRLAVLDLSGTGGETVDISFLDAAGKEKTATLHALGEAHTLYEAYDLFAHIPEDGHDLYSSNFSTKMLNSKCGYFMLCAETTGSQLRDMIASYRGESKYALKLFRKKLRSLKDKGMEYLVIDLRNNMGGIDAVGCALYELLSDERQYCRGLGIRKNGKYSCVLDQYISGDGEFSDLKVVALTNFECISGGDAVSLYLSKLPNVTLAGITDPNGSGQETGGLCILSDGIVSVGYPTGLILDEKGELFNDTRADRLSRNAAEVRIPLDKAAAMSIFRDKKDYELEWAVNYLENS